MTNEKTIEDFMKSVKQVTLAIDLRIEAKDYDHARSMVDDMEAILKRIVSSMFLRGHIGKQESDLFNAFINRIVADKRTIIYKSEKLRGLEYEEDYNLFFTKVKNKWEGYITPPFDEESKQTDSSNNSNWCEPDDDEEDL